MDFLTNFLKESNGNPSSTRLMTLAVLVTALIDWQHAIWMTNMAWNPNPEVVMIILGVLGLKVGQKFTEEKK